MYGNNYPNDYESNQQNETYGNQDSNQNSNQNLNQNTGAYPVNQNNQSDANANVQQNTNQTYYTQSSYNGYQTQNTQPTNHMYQTQNTQQPRGMYSGYMPTNAIPPIKPPQKEKKGSGAGAFWKKAFAVAMAGVLFGVCAAGSFYAVDSIAGITTRNDKKQTTAEEVLAGNDAVVTAAKPSQNQVVTTVVTDVTAVVEKVMPSAVSITNSYTAIGQTFFGERYASEEEASGSGIIIGQNDTELLVVTNNHVVADANALTVQFIDGEQVSAQLKGHDATMDLAVIAINLSDISESTLNSISVAQMGDSSSLSIGEPAIAIGNSLGYGQSVTTGVISAVDRELEVEGEILETTLIQTDAAINPGNSGGALVNMNGEVIGINSNKIGGSIIEGMGYAIPISAAKQIIENLMSKETRSKVADEERGYLGIKGANITREITEVYAGMPKGVYIVAVTTGSAAEKAGLMKGNIITKMEGISVAEIEELNEMLSYYKAGDTITLTIAVGSPEGYIEKDVSVTLSGVEVMMRAAE